MGMRCHIQQAIITQLQTVGFAENLGLAVSLKDVGTMVVAAICATSALSTILTKSVAFSLGQINQLVMIGFLLSIMDLCMQLEAQKLLLVLEARFGKSTLQNYDAILRSDTFFAGISHQI